MPENFLDYFQQTGASNIYDPVRSKERGINILSARQNIQSSQLNDDMKRIQIGQSGLKQVRDKDDYQGYRKWMVNQIGASPELFPESFGTPQEFKDWQGSTLISFDAMAKMQQGQPYVITNRKTGMTQNIRSKDDYDRLVERGVINPDDYDFGEQPTAKAGSRLTYSKKNEDGSVRTLKNIVPGSEQERQLIGQGFNQGTQTVGIKPSAKERETKRQIGAVDKLSEQATTDPNRFHEKHNFKQNEDGSLFLDPVTNAPVKLPPFWKGTGKRGNIKAIIGLGEQWDDAQELTELLEKPEVRDNLNAANDEGIWDSVQGKWSNTINKWMQDKGISKNSDTATAVARIQRMTSEERKKFMGTAVTDNEIKSALAWMPSAGDSFESIVNKTNLMGKEAEQEFRRWVSIFEDDVDMSPFYKAFGIDRFGVAATQPAQQAQQVAPQSALDALSANPNMIDEFEAFYGYRPEGF